MTRERFRTRGAATIEADVRRDRSELVVQTETGTRRFVLQQVGPAEFLAHDPETPDRIRRLHAIREGVHTWIWLEGRSWRLEAIEAGAGAASQAPGGLAAPIPATVQEVLVADGDVVEADQVLVVLSAMKMQLEVKAPHPGIVAGLALRVGDQVDGGAPLLQVLSPDSA